MREWDWIQRGYDIEVPPEIAPLLAEAVRIRRKEIKRDLATTYEELGRPKMPDKHDEPDKYDEAAASYLHITPKQPENPHSVVCSGVLEKILVYQLADHFRKHCEPVPPKTHEDSGERCTVAHYDVFDGGHLLPPCIRCKWCHRDIRPKNMGEPCPARSEKE